MGAYAGGGTEPVEGGGVGAMAEPGGAGSDPPNALAARVEAAAAVLGVSLGAPTRSRRHGYRPEAKAHVERYFLSRVYGVSVGDLARSTNHTRRNVAYSIRVGAALTRANARALGLTVEDVLGLGTRQGA